MMPIDSTKPDKSSNEYIADFTQAKISIANRAPNAGDKGLFWVQFVEGSDTTITLYIRHPRTGTWRSVNLT